MARPDRNTEEYHPIMTAFTNPDRIYFTDDDEANQLLATDPMALLIGMVLDQQVTVQKAFSGPLELKKRIGTLDAAKIAATDASQLEAAFRRAPRHPPFSGNMARRTQAFAQPSPTSTATIRAASGPRPGTQETWSSGC